MVLSYTSHVRQAQRDILGPEVLEERRAGNKGAALSPRVRCFPLRDETYYSILQS